MNKKIINIYRFIKEKDGKKNFAFEEIKKSEQFSKLDYLEITLSSFRYEGISCLESFIFFVKKFNKTHNNITKYVRIQFYIEMHFSHSIQYSHLLPSTPIEKLDFKKILIMLREFDEKYKQYFEDAYGSESLKSVKLKALGRGNIQKKISPELSGNEIEKSILYTKSFFEKFKNILVGLKTLIFN